MSNNQAEHEKWMRRAIDLAAENARSGNGGPFGALIVNGQRVVATGVNSVTATNDPTAHAEVMAIRAACQTLGDFRLDDCVLYASCEPCPMCLAAIYWARLACYYFAGTRETAAQAGFDDARIYQEIAREPAQRSTPGYRLLAESGVQPFLAWAQSLRKIPY